MSDNNARVPALPTVKEGRCELDRDSSGYVAWLEVTGDVHQQMLAYELMTRFGVVDRFNQSYWRGQKARTPITLRKLDEPQRLYLWMPGCGSWDTAKRRLTSFVTVYNERLLEDDGLDEAVALIWDLINPDGPCIEERYLALVSGHELTQRRLYGTAAHKTTRSPDPVLLS